MYNTLITVSSHTHTKKSLLATSSLSQWIFSHLLDNEEVSDWRTGFTVSLISTAM